MNVEKHLVKKGRHDIEGKSSTKIGKSDYRIDIVSSKDNKLFYTEVKTGLHSHRLETAIGQLLVHKHSAKQPPKPEKFQIYLPSACEKAAAHFTDNGLSEALGKLGIEILFV